MAKIIKLNSGRLRFGELCYSLSGTWKQFKKGYPMWVILFIVALLFVLGSALLLLRSAKVPKIPDHVKSQPYKNEDDDW
ncbi:MAG: hypothetical protein ACU83P_09680 [Gammaproteobacteria bacterium]